MSQIHNQQRRKQYKRFPCVKVAKMWAQGMTIAEIAQGIKRVDENNPKDPYHSLRNLLFRMHRGYVADGKIVRLPYRVSKKTVRAARKAGLRAW